ncbi:M56 family metallopeptidase [candidate division KSB1 bacterium]
MVDNFITFLNNISQIWVNYFVLMFIQSSLFLIIILGILFLFRRSNAKLLYAISIIGLLKLFVPPVFILNSGFDPAFKLSGLLGLDSFYQSNAELVGNFPDMMIIQQNPQLTFFSFVLLIWITGILIYILINIIKYVQLKKVLGNLTPVDQYRPDNKSISIFKSEKSHSPLVLGYFKHKIIVPKHWDHWTDNCRDSVVEHEIAHIKNKDTWICILELIAQVLYLFNPLVWIFCKKVDRYREMHCDDEAVRKLNLSHINYSKSLVKITESIQDYNSIMIKTAFSKSSDEFKNRILYQLNKQNTKINSKILSSPVFVILVLLIFPFSTNSTIKNYAPKPVTANIDLIRKNINESRGKLVEIFEEDFKNSLNSGSYTKSDILILKNESSEKDLIYRFKKENIEKP